MTDPTRLIFPDLGQLYQALAPWTEVLLRVVVGLALVPHGLRNTLGLWPSTGVRSHNVTELAQQLENEVYRPEKFWARAISLTELVVGPLLARAVYPGHPERAIVSARPRAV